MLLSGAGLAVMPSWASKGDTKRVTILHTNDIHCHLDPFPESDVRFPNKGGLSRISAYVRAFRAQNQNMLLFDSGDFSQGTPYYNYYKADLILKLMSEMGYDASCIGNHEFDNGLQSLADAVGVANFPILSTNYAFRGTPVESKAKDNLIVERAGFRFGIYSLGVNPDGLVDPKNIQNVTYLDPIEVAQKQEEYLRNEEDCDIVICLSHLGYKYPNENLICDLDIAQNTRSTDIILGGHTHTFFDKPIELDNLDGQKVILNQAGWGALMLGRLDLVLQRHRNIVNVGVSNVNVG